MSAAARTRSTESELRRLMLVAKFSWHRDPLEDGDAEAVRHARDVVRHTRREVVALAAGADTVGIVHVVVEKRPDHPRHALLLAPGGGAEVDAVEHERPQTPHRLADLLALHD